MFFRIIDSLNHQFDSIKSISTSSSMISFASEMKQVFNVSQIFFYLPFQLNFMYDDFLHYFLSLLS